MLLFDKITPEIAALVDRAHKGFDLHPVLTARPGVFTDRQRATAKEMTEWCVLPDLYGGHLAMAAQELPPIVFTVLVLSCGCKFGMQKIEDLLGIPARSCKVVLLIGLDELERKGIAECLL